MSSAADSKGAICSSIRLAEGGDLLVEEDVGEDRPHPDRVQVIEVTLQGLAQGPAAGGPW